ncbi:nitrogenase molybdenum-iron protein alpha chain, partial [Rhizobium ruizarguesonis]
MSLDYENDGDFNARLIDEVLSQYPDKTAKRRKKHLGVAKGREALEQGSDALCET